jgi:REP element-mobilizing transposase RayT
MPERLKRLDMVYQNSPIYIVTAGTAKRRKMLANEAIHSAFKAFGDCAADCGAWVGAYVFMPDQVHLFVAIDAEQLSLSDWMKSLKGTLSSKLRAQGMPRHIGRKDSSITYFAVVTCIRENGTMCGKILFEPAWQQIGNSGRTLVRYLISNFTTRVFDYKCDGQRPPLQRRLHSA